MLALTLFISLVQQPLPRQALPQRLVQHASVQQSVIPSSPAERPVAAKHLAIAASASAGSAQPGSKVSLFLDITPRPRIHVYAPGAKDYLPIAMIVDRRSGITPGDVKYPKSQTMVFGDEKVPVYDKPFRLVQEVSLDRSLKAGEAVTITGTVKYQACDDQVCFIPVSLPVSWTIAITN